MHLELAMLKSVYDQFGALKIGSFGNTQDEDIDDLYNIFLKHRNSLHEKYPEIFEGHKIKDYKKFKDDPKLSRYYHDEAIRAIRSDIKFYMSTIQNVKENIPEVSLTTEGLFIAGQEFQAYSKILSIIQTTQSEIALIDGYVDNTVLDMFTELGDNITFKILTKQQSNKPAFKQAVIKFNSQYNDRLECRTNEDFHDRFLIIDKKDFYHFGASIKDGGKRGFMFSKIEEPKWKDMLLTEFDKSWG